MTPQTQAEQKARELLEDVIFACDKESVAEPKMKRFRQELTLLIQKADALDWLEKEVAKSKWAYLLDNLEIKSGETLLSAINQARKE